MIRLLYCNINNLSEPHPVFLPEFMRTDIARYKHAADRKVRLAARFMLYKCLEADGRPELIHQWRKDAHHKPFISGWLHFNISHSAELAVFVCGEDPMGIDIEKNTAQDYTEMAAWFHPEEQAFIWEAPDTGSAFYTIWTRKEALLKAVGTGIVNGLSHVSCLGERVDFQGKSWYFYKISIHEDYTCCLCAPVAPNASILRVAELR